MAPLATGVSIPPASALETVLIRREGPGQRSGGLHPEGLEPPTLGSEDRCSIQLSYECGAAFEGNRVGPYVPRRTTGKGDLWHSPATD